HRSRPDVLRPRASSAAPPASARVASRRRQGSGRLRAHRRAVGRADVGRIHLGRRRRRLLHPAAFSLRSAAPATAAGRSGLNGLPPLRPLLASILVAGAVFACGGHASLSEAESDYLNARRLKDQIEVTRARGAQSTPGGLALKDLLAKYRVTRDRLRAALPAESSVPAGADRRAIEVMRRALEKDLGEEKEAPADAAPGAPESVDCGYDTAFLVRGQDGMQNLGERMYACFGKAAHHLTFEGQTLDRLTVFSLLPIT